MVVGLEKVVFGEGNRKLRADPALTLNSSDSTPKLNTNMVKPRKRHFIESDSDILNNSLNYLAGHWTFLHLKDVKISWCIILFIVRGCYDRTQSHLHGLSKLFLHLKCALCFCMIMISYLVFFHVNYWYVIKWFFLCNVEYISTCQFFQRPQIAFALRARAILLVFEKNLQVLIYFKLHSKSYDYLYELHVNDSLLPIT